MSHLTRDVIDGFFRDNARRGCVLSEQDMLWGYFFTHGKRAVLEAARPAIEALGYRYVDILGRQRLLRRASLFLHVERVERHTPESLFARCNELSALATRLGLATFDGFDVGHVDGSILYE